MFSVSLSPDLQDSIMKIDFGEGMPLTLSTFAGKPMRGGWIPIYTQYEDGAPIITDWICPYCYSLTGQSRTCPHCGLEKQEIPIFKDLSRPEREYKSNYKLWIVEQLRLEDGVRDRNRGRPQDQQQADSEPTANQEATGRRREAHASTRY